MKTKNKSIIIGLVANFTPISVKFNNNQFYMLPLLSYDSVRPICLSTMVVFANHDEGPESPLRESVGHLDISLRHSSIYSPI